MVVPTQCAGAVIVVTNGYLKTSHRRRGASRIEQALAYWCARWCDRLLAWLALQRRKCGAQRNGLVVRAHRVNTMQSGARSLLG